MQTRPDNSIGSSRLTSTRNTDGRYEKRSTRHSTHKARTASKRKKGESMTRKSLDAINAVLAKPKRAASKLLKRLMSNLSCDFCGKRIKHGELFYNMQVQRNTEHIMTFGCGAPYHHCCRNCYKKLFQKR